MDRRSTRSLRKGEKEKEGAKKPKTPKEPPNVPVDPPSSDSESYMLSQWLMQDQKAEPWSAWRLPENPEPMNPSFKL
ncbi:hypothetical protein FQN53_000323 [Emmonsiellopsis sp. PD_33]|nr:hypothetical protein FQN53_000323 [Emmonsiellopsis sp. PD_33]